MRKMTVVIVILSLAALAGVVLNRHVAATRALRSEPTQAAVVKTGLRRAELSIKGMWCVSCATGAEYSLKAIEGVEDAYVGFTGDLEGEGWVVYREGEVSEEEIVKAVEPYKATIVSDRAYPETK
jgi:copper chaperone CopZ